MSVIISYDVDVDRDVSDDDYSSFDDDVDDVYDVMMIILPNWDAFLTVRNDYDVDDEVWWRQLRLSAAL